MAIIEEIYDLYASERLRVIHSDVCGLMKTTSKRRCKYLVNFIDDLSRDIRFYPINAKSEYFDKFKEFKDLVGKESKLKIKVFRSDNCGEFISKKFDDFLKKKSIPRQT